MKPNVYFTYKIFGHDETMAITKYKSSRLNIDLSAKAGYVGLSSIYFNSILNRTNMAFIEVRKAAKIRNLYNQVPHLTQDTIM